MDLSSPDLGILGFVVWLRDVPWRPSQQDAKTVFSNDENQRKQCYVIAFLSRTMQCCFVQSRA